MNDTGFIKIPRSIWSNPRIKMEGWLSVWVWILCRAAHNGMEVIWKGQRTQLKPGQFTASRLEISMQTGVTQGQVWRVLQALRNEQHIEQQGSNVCTMITVTKIDSYQYSEQHNEQQNSSRIAANEQLNNPSQDIVARTIESEFENVRERSAADDYLKHCKKGSILDNKDFAKSWTEWSRYRNEKDKPLTPLAVKEQIAYLESQSDCQAAINIIKQTIRNGWTKF